MSVQELVARCVICKKQITASSTSSTYAGLLKIIRDCQWQQVGYSTSDGILWRCPEHRFGAEDRKVVPISLPEAQKPKEENSTRMRSLDEIANSAAIDRVAQLDAEITALLPDKSLRLYVLEEKPWI